MSSQVLGIDIGGANLKYATVDGRCFERSFPLWTQSEGLAEQLASDVARFESVQSLAVTMTGELADCFLARAQGVRFIVEQVAQCIPAVAPEQVRFYGTDGRFHSADEAKANWETIAASNWHALASCVGQRVAPDALLIDVGSTTTDVIAISRGEVLTSASTDFQRLCDQSLVYIGCRRTPVCALVSYLGLRGVDVPVMNEVFATLDDARLLTGVQPEDSTDCQTADSHPRDRTHAKIRIARMIGLDAEQISSTEANELAQQIHATAVKTIRGSIEKWWRRLQVQSDTQTTWVLSGHGQDLVRPPADARYVDLREALSCGLSRVAPAWAVAVLGER